MAEQPDRIVVGVDGSESSKLALQWAARIAAATGATIETVTAWDMPVSYGWAIAADDWNPEADAYKVLSARPSTRRSMVLARPGCALSSAEATQRGCSSTRAKARRCSWSVAAVMVASLACCWDR